VEHRAGAPAPRGQHPRRWRTVRLLFVARAMHAMAGGVERMVITVMNEMAARGHSVSLFSWDRADARAFYPMTDAIIWHRLDMGHPGERAGLRLVAARAAAVRHLLRGVR